MSRWISGIILAAALIALLLFAEPRICQWIVIALSLLAGAELARLFLQKFTMPLRALFVCLTGIGVLTIMNQRDFLSLASYLYMIVGVAFVIGLFPSRLIEMPERLLSSACFVLGLVYLTTGFGFLASLFDLANARFWIFLAVASTFMGDTTAYLFGRAWGSHKLAPEISPGKTVEGLFGGLLGGMLAAIVVRMLFWPEFPLGMTLLLGFVIALLGVVGDLAESLVKRAMQVKDSGSIIPGHGGLLDRVDALLFTAPFVYLVAVTFF